MGLQMESMDKERGERVGRLWHASIVDVGRSVVTWR